MKLHTSFQNKNKSRVTVSWACRKVAFDCLGCRERGSHRRSIFPLYRGPWRCYDGSMMVAIAFDTYRFVKRLTECGSTEKQAETLAEEHVAVLNANLATRADIRRPATGNHGRHRSSAPRD